MYIVFARKYRPERFEDVVGQQHVTRTLQNAVRTGRVAHAYLFCGSRGVGKTSVARILAKALNCKDGPTPQPCGQCESCRHIALGDDLDVMEIDGASNRGVDQVRELRQNVRLAPSRSRFKIYYIDEVHMLTEPAFNALLKTLEEPPAHVKFIFSTTDPQNLPETVKSRCQRFDFHRIADADIAAYLRRVCQAEGLQAEDGALEALARAARGSLRDALGMLDQLSAFGTRIGINEVLSVLGAVDSSMLAKLADALAAQDTATALRVTHEALLGGADVEDFADQFGQYLRDLLVASICGAKDPLLSGSAADAETLQRQASLFSTDQLIYMIQLLREAKLRARRDTTGRLALELAIVEMSRLSDLADLQEALAELSAGAQGTPAKQNASPASNRPTPTPALEGAEALRRMGEKLKNRQQQSSPPVAPPGVPPAALTEADCRRIVDAAEDPETGHQALKDEGLMRAYKEGNRVLGLNPIKLERRMPKEKPERLDEDHQAEPPE